MKYLPIGKDLFIHNRENFISLLKPKSLAIFNSNDLMPTNADGTMPFRQNNDIFYLSGIDQEESILVLFPDYPDEKFREILFVTETNPHIAVWEGHKYTREEAYQTSGVRTVLWLSQFEQTLNALMAQAENVYLNTNEHMRNASATETRNMRFAKWCRNIYVGWRMIQAFLDPDGNGDDAKGMTKRIGFFISGLVYLFFAFSGVRLLFPTLGSSNGGGSGGKRQLLVAKLLELPYGQWLVGAVAVLVIGKGLYQLYKSYSGKFKNKVKEQEMGRKERNTFMKAGYLGYVARGIVFIIVGYFLIQAALQSDASAIRGTEGALNFLSTSWGPYLMAAVAVGLALYGVFMCVLAKYRYIPNIRRQV